MEPQAAPIKRHWKRNAAFFIGGQFLSMFGSMLVSHAVSWHVTLTEKSGTLLGLFTCAAMLPMVLVSPFAGVWADRYSRKGIVNLSDSAIALVTLAVALSFGAGEQRTWLLLAAVVARSVGQGVQQPAVSALIPQIVPERHLARFNGIQSTAQSLTMFASPVAAAALLNYLPLQQVFYIDVVTAAVGIAAVFFCVKVERGSKKPAARASGAKAYFAEMSAGLRFVKTQPWLKTLLVFSALFGILASPAAMLTPLQVARSFGGIQAAVLPIGEYGMLSSLEIAFAVGMMGGGILITAWGGFKNKARTMILSWLLFGGFTVLFGVVPSLRGAIGLVPAFGVYLAVMAFCGVSMPLYNTPCMTIMQTKIPMDLMGRVFAVLMALNGLAMPIGMALFGPLADRVMIESLLLATGALLVVGGLLLATRREVVEAGKAILALGEEGGR